MLHWRRYTLWSQTLLKIHDTVRSGDRVIECDTTQNWNCSLLGYGLPSASTLSGNNRGTIWWYRSKGYKYLAYLESWIELSKNLAATSNIKKKLKQPCLVCHASACSLASTSWSSPKQCSNSDANRHCCCLRISHFCGPSLTDTYVLHACSLMFIYIPNAHRLIVATCSDPTLICDSMKTVRNFELVRTKSVNGCSEDSDFVLLCRVLIDTAPKTPKKAYWIWFRLNDGHM